VDLDNPRGSNELVRLHPGLDQDTGPRSRGRVCHTYVHRADIAMAAKVCRFQMSISGGLQR
jgi:hypothetical protein